MINSSSSNFFRISGNRAAGREVRVIEQSEKRSSKRSVYLVPFTMLSVSPFKFPFSGVARIREAIRLQTISYFASDTIQIFPVQTSKTAKESLGFSCFLPDGEIAGVEAIVGIRDKQSVLLPAPFCLVSAVGGDGITIWADEVNVCSVLWNSGLPEMSRWRTRKSDADVETELEWMRKYASSKERKETEPFVFDVLKNSEALPDIIKKSLADFAWLRELNLSRSALNTALVLEKFVREFARAAMWLAVVGTIFAAGSWLSYASASASARDVRERSERMYREVFDKDGRIVDPVSQARAKINALKGSGTGGQRFGNVLTDLGTAWKNGSLSVTLDSVRYNPDGADITGSASDMTTIQSMRTSLVDLGGTVQLGDVQQIPGGGFRFNIALRW